MAELIVISSKIPKELHTLLLHYCDKEGITPSKFIQDIVQENVLAVVPIHKAGRNELSYDKKTDSFSWKLVYDDGAEVVVSEYLRPEFLENLNAQISAAISSRSDYIKKKELSSVPIPTRMKKLKMVRKHARS